MRSAVVSVGQGRPTQRGRRALARTRTSPVPTRHCAMRLAMQGRGWMVVLNYRDINVTDTRGMEVEGKQA